MAVDYTKVFTVIGSYVDKVNDYYSFISAFSTDQAAIETILSAQTLTRLEGELPNEYLGFKNDVSTWTTTLINRVSTVLTDEALIGANFSFGTSPSLDIVFPDLIHDMATTDKNVKPSVGTVGSVTTVSENALVGYLATGTVLDSITPPMSGAIAIEDYAGLTSQLLPDSETITFTCITDSESGGVSKGSEQFSVTGTQAGSDPYSATGENIGTLSNITCADSQINVLATNTSLDSWTDGIPDGWSLDSGAAGVDYEEGADSVFDDLANGSIHFLATDNEVNFLQTLNNSLFTRGKSYFISAWAKKYVDTLADQLISITIYDDAGTLATLPVQPTTTAWTGFSIQFVVPKQVIGNLTLQIQCTNASTCDSTFLDQIVIAPCEYISGVAMAIFQGPEKWIRGDTLSLTLSNDNAGKFQTFFRKAYKIQLPTDPTPTISDGLVT